MIHRLREIRKISDLKIKDLARQLGITPDYLGAIERGDSKPGGATLAAIRLWIELNAPPDGMSMNFNALMAQLPESSRQAIALNIVRLVRHYRDNQEPPEPSKS